MQEQTDAHVRYELQTNTMDRTGLREKNIAKTALAFVLSNGYVSSNTTHTSTTAIHNNCSCIVIAGNLTLCG